jgi:AraC-like DNA-binding protein
MSKVDQTAGARSPEYFSLQIAEARRFYLPASRGRVPMRVVSGGVERCSPDYQLDRIGFPYLGVEFVAAGRGWLSLGDAPEIALTSGVVFSYDRRVRHVIRVDPRQPLVKYFVDFAGTDGRRWLDRAGLRAGRHAHLSAPDGVLALFDELIRAGLAESAHTHAICEHLLKALLLRIGDSSVAAAGLPSRAFERYVECRRLLEREFLQIRTLQSLAERCGVDEAYLCRLFRRFDTVSPYQRLMRLRMTHAAARLREPGILVKQVSAELGFATPFHFSRVFRSVHGISPTRAQRASNHR